MLRRTRWVKDGITFCQQCTTFLMHLEEQGDHIGSGTHFAGSPAARCQI